MTETMTLPEQIQHDHERLDSVVAAVNRLAGMMGTSPEAQAEVDLSPLLRRLAALEQRPTVPLRVRELDAAVAALTETVAHMQVPYAVTVDHVPHQHDAYAPCEHGDHGMATWAMAFDARLARNEQALEGLRRLLDGLTAEVSNLILNHEELKSTVQQAVEDGATQLGVLHDRLEELFAQGETHTHPSDPMLAVLIDRVAAAEGYTEDLWNSLEAVRGDLAKHTHPHEHKALGLAAVKPKSGKMSTEHVHQFDTMGTDGLWRCGLCGEAKEEKP